MATYVVREGLVDASSEAASESRQFEQTRCLPPTVGGEGLIHEGKVRAYTSRAVCRVRAPK